MDNRLYRSRSDRMVAGVAAGVADMLDVDPTIVRVIWAVLIPFTGFAALLVYVIMAIVVPEEPYLGAAQVPWPPAAPGAPAPGWGSAATTAPSAPEAPPATGAAGPAATVEAGAAGTPSLQPGVAPAASPAAPGWTAGEWRTQRRADRAARRAERTAWRAEHRSTTGPIVGALVLIVLGAIFLARELIPNLDWGLTWPLALIALGVLLLLGSIRRAP